MADANAQATAQGNTNAGGDGQSAQSTGADGSTVLTGGKPDASAAASGNDNGGKPADQTGASKDGNGDQGKPAVPEKYELKMPDGVEIDQKAIDAFTPVFKELGLTNESAQKLVEHYIKQQSDQNAGLEAAHAQQIEEWGQQAREDKDIGGNNLQKSADLGMKALAAYMPDMGEREQILRDLAVTGLGNKPAWVRLFRNIGLTVKEDTSIPSGDSSGGRKSNAEVFYGT